MKSAQNEEAIEDLVDGGVPADSAGSWIKVATIPEIGKVVTYIFAARGENLTDASKLVKIRSFVQKNSHGFILAYCLSSRESFRRITELHRFLASIRGNDVPLFLIGLQSDRADSREVTLEEGKDLATKIHALAFYEFSSKEENRNTTSASVIVERVLQTAFEKKKSKQQNSDHQKGLFQKLFSSSSEKKKDASNIPEMDTRSSMPVANILILGSRGIGIRSFAVRYLQNYFVEL